MKCTKKELNLIWDALTGRYVSSLRAGDDERAKKYYNIRKKVEKQLEKVV
jgi:hypothetical protein